MERVVNVDMTINTAKAETALNKFFKKYADLAYWREQLEYMLDNGIESESNIDIGTSEWTWAVHAQQDDHWFYFAIIERA
jgi:hypothetical protein